MDLKLVQRLFEHAGNIACALAIYAYVSALIT